MKKLLAYFLSLNLSLFSWLIFFVGSVLIIFSVATPVSFSENTTPSENFSLEGTAVGAYFCATCCARSVEDTEMQPEMREVEVGETVSFSAYEWMQSCNGAIFRSRVTGTGNTSNLVWQSSDPQVATVSPTGQVTTLADGEVEISASWETSIIYSEIIDCGGGGGQLSPKKEKQTENGRNGSPNILPDECVRCYTIREAQGTGATLTVRPPRVASISAQIPPTSNIVTGATPVPTVFSTTNNSLIFATESTTSDLLVVFQSSNINLSVRAEGVMPSTATNLLKWKIERDSSDTVATGTPTLSTQVGGQLQVTPNIAGNFRLICYYDRNRNSVFDSGEQLRVLQFSVVRASIDTSRCTISTPGSFTNGTNNGVDTSNAMRISCEVVLESGGPNGRVGLGQIHLGGVGNLRGENFTINYPIPIPPPPPPGNQVGTGVENPGGILPMIDTSRVNPGNEPTGADTAFRFSSMEVISPRTSGGQLRSVTIQDSPGYGWNSIHPTTNNPWANTLGGNAFREFVVGYTDTFPRSYVGLARGDWETVVIGVPNHRGEWQQDTGATIRVNNAISVSITNGSPQSGDTAGAQVLGRSFVNEYRIDYMP